MKTIIFDFGNVVGFFDHMRALRRLEPYTTMSAREMYAAVIAGDLEDAFEANRISEEEFLACIVADCKLSCSREILAEACADIFWPNPEICELIPKLKPRYRLLLGSNTNPIHSRFYRKQFADVLRHFDALVLSHEIGVRKPKAGFFEHCQALADGRPDECLFLDDVADNIAAARKHGWQGILYQANDGVLEKMRVAGVML